jgi:hypothetical protein
MKIHSLLLVSVLFVTACAHQPNLHIEQLDASIQTDYQSFNISSLTLKGQNIQENDKIELAIRTSLEQKGMSYSTNDAQVTVQYALGIKKIQNVDLKPIVVGSGVYTSHLIKDEKYATLLINIRDNKQQKNIWRLSGSRRIDDEQLPQGKINEKFSELLENFNR